MAKQFGIRRRALSFEPLEDRRLLSVAAALPPTALAHPTFALDLHGGADFSGSATAVGLSPNQVRGAYALGSYSTSGLTGGITFPGMKNGAPVQIPGDGSGQTIAIVDAYNDPTAATDLNNFSTAYGLPTFGGSGPTFTQYNENGTTSPLPGNDPNGPSDSTGLSTWEMEESLDIEWAHAMAPLANIDLFEADSAYPAELYAAVRMAAGTPGVVVVSMSWSGDEPSNASTLDSLNFVTPANHYGGSSPTGGGELYGGVTFLAASGDSGAYDPGTTNLAPQYPATSPNVVAVGATTLTESGSDPSYTWVSETGWGNGTNSGQPIADGGGGSGGGISGKEGKPSYQRGVVPKSLAAKRAYPDVSADGDPNTGVAIYDSYDFGNASPWLSVAIGGTSLAAPLWAGMIAIADEGRAIDHLGSLDGPSQTLPALYALPAADFHDITIGNNGYAAGPGYDLVSGIGSPVGNLLIPQLVGPTVAMPAAASASTVTRTTVNLSVLGADSAALSPLTYTWAATTVPGGTANPTFSDNGDTTADETQVTFNEAGTYVFTVTISDTAGLSVSSDANGLENASVTVTVNQTLTSFDVTAAPFVATALDQFGNPMVDQPQVPWSLDGDSVAFDSAAGAMVSLDGVSPSFANVSFNSTAGYTLAQQGAGGTLNLANGTSAAMVAVATASDTISAPLVLDSSVTLLPAAGSQLILSGGISGDGALTVAAPGTVVVTGPSSYSGGTTVTAGTLVFTDRSAISAGTSLTIGAGGTMIFDPTVSAASAEAAPATASPAASSADTSVAAAVSASASAAPPAGQISNPPLSSQPLSPVGPISPIHVAQIVTLPLSSQVADYPPRAPGSLPQVVSKSPADSSPQLPVAPPLVSAPRGIVPRTVLPAALPSSTRVAVVPSLADSSFMLSQSASGVDTSDQLRKKDVAMLAFEMVFADWL